MYDWIRNKALFMEEEIYGDGFHIHPLSQYKKTNTNLGFPSNQDLFLFFHEFYHSKKTQHIIFALEGDYLLWISNPDLMPDIYHFHFRPVFPDKTNLFQDIPIYQLKKQLKTIAPGATLCFFYPYRIHSFLSKINGGYSCSPTFTVALKEVSFKKNKSSSKKSFLRR